MQLFNPYGLNKSNEKAKKLGLLFWENVYGDSINHYGCRSIWFDSKHRIYRVEGLVVPVD
jgi:hypothetical protein